MKRVVILGAGYGGVLTAKKLAKKIKKQGLSNEIEITIIDKNPFHTMLTELHEVACQRVDEDSIKISLSKVFAGRKVNVVLDEIQNIDYDKKRLTGKCSSYDYDYLVLASGSKPTYFGVEGAKENTFPLWSYKDAIRLREHIPEMFRQASCELDPDKRRELLTFFVVGAGFTGVEMAGELAELVPSLCEKYEIDRKDVRLVNVDVLERSCMIFPPRLSNKVEARLAKMHVDVMLKTNIVKVTENSIDYKKGDKIISERTSTVVWAAGVEASDISSAGSKKIGQGARGRIQTDAQLRAVNNKSIYAAGDNISYIPEGEKTPVPQMVENCEQSADVIANNLMSDLLGKNEYEDYKPQFHGVMVCVGGRYGVAHVGLPGKFFSLASFFAMFAKHFINIIYFIQVLGFNKIASYVYHEFLTIRNKRSFVGGYFSNRSASFMLVPLRMYLGIFWIVEGFKKINQGWFSTYKLYDFINSANQFFNGILNPGTSDAVTAATSEAATTTVAASAGTVLINFNILNLVRIIYVHASDYAIKVQVGLVDLFTNKLLLRNNGVNGLSGFLQIFIVVSEILIGLALIGGLFTTISSAYSLVLQMLFLTTTGIYMATWWMVFASIAMMFGAGRVFSLDYYVMPFLKSKWKKLKFVRKWYIYND